MQKLNEKSHPQDQIGLVISSFGSSVAVEAENGQVFQCHLHRNQDLPIVGDTVCWHLENNSGLITAIQARRSLLIRGDSRGNKKPIAANIDAIVIVMAPPPIFSELLVDRYTVAAELLQITPILILNKIDLLDQNEKQVVIERLAPYHQIGYGTVLSSAITTHGLDDVILYLQNKKVVLVGPSGVGKSSIISAICQENIRVNEVSGKGIGKHTTTTTHLYHLPMGGEIIDSPGVRDYHLWSVSKQEILQGFKEFHDYLGSCRFRDCQHLAEPNCTIKKAVAEGKINIKRYASYQAMMETLSS